LAIWQPTNIFLTFIHFSLRFRQTNNAQQKNKQGAFSPCWSSNSPHAEVGVFHQPYFVKPLFNNLQTIKIRNNLAARVAGEKHQQGRKISKAKNLEGSLLLQ
jgi:hypothetical protein